MSSTVDHFQAALQSLTRQGSIKDRLTEAVQNHLALVEEEELPYELRETFRSFIRTLTREPPLLRGEDAVRATVRKMSSEEAAEVASAVVRMYATLSCSALANSRGKGSKSPSNVVPMYLAEA